MLLLLIVTQYSSKENFVGVGYCNLSAINTRTRGIYIAEPNQCTVTVNRFGDLPLAVTEIDR